MNVHGAKGSIKNRIYQFWLIRIWRKKQKKRKEEALLRKRRLIETRKKIIEEVVGQRETKRWKLSKTPIALGKKEGIVVKLFPVGKRPDKVVEVVEEKPKVGIGVGQELDKKLEKLEKETTKVVSQVGIEIKKEVEPEKLEAKKKKLEQELYKIEILQKEYQQVKRKNPKLSNIALIKEGKIKQMVVGVQTLESAEQMCKKELSRVETALQSIRKVEKKEVQEILKETKKRDPEKLQEGTKIENSSMKQKPVDSNLKRSVVMGAVAGGTLIVFPVLFQKSMQKKSQMEEKRNSNSQLKTLNQPVQNEKSIESKNEKSSNQKKSNERKSLKLKIYRSRLEASKEAEILIKAELERQKNYLHRMNEKIEQVDISKKVEYRFQGLHHLLGQVLTFTLGVLTIPFSKHRIFGTALGLTLIGNSIRGMRNSLRLKEEQRVYIEWKDFTQHIYNEQLALKQLNTMVVTSLQEIKELKEDVEMEFYGKIPFDEYDKMKTKLEAIELKLLEKQKQIIAVEEQLQKVEEKNKVKVKKMQEIKRQP
ncbi:MAG: hypothetical protein HFH08_03045 [Bacilli bacterium]|nr:hypothetical protein [Bacilli bacterium]